MNAPHNAKTPSRRTGRFATCGAHLAAKGALAASHRHRGLAAVVLSAALLTALGIAPNAAAAPPESFWTRCAADTEADVQCGIPRGIATSPVDGRVFVADQVNRRIVEFSAWGQFVRTWGWDVVQSGPGDNGSGFEVCVPADGDVCKAGTAGAGAGQFGDGSPQGVAIDSVGNVYVVDRGLPSNQRVQKFDSEGHFIRMWGKGVNTGTAVDKEICTNAGPPTDVCGLGGEGAGPGQFGKLSVVGSYIAIDTLGTASAADDKVYVGDEGRIQRFNTDGEYQSEIAVPGERVKGLAVDPAGDLYASFCGASESGCGSTEPPKANVRKLSPAGVELATIAVASPQGLATDPAGDLYVIDGKGTPTIREFDSSGVEVPVFAFTDGFSGSTGIATGSACLSTGHALYVSNADFVNGFLRAYGPLPDEAHAALCPPPPHAPEIVDQGTLSVEEDQAVVQATINPKFWADTSYYVQYGTATCIEEEPLGWNAPCVMQKPLLAAQLGVGAVDEPVKTAKVSLTDLTPQTGYSYRFVAESSGGGPVFGSGGTEATEGKPSAFTTLGSGSATVAETDCPNQAFRTGPSAFLPDCRAYEMVSPIDKNGGDIVNEHSFIQVSLDGNRITYSTLPAFGDQPSNTGVNQYLASRQAGVGWSDRGISPPLGRQSTLGITAGLFNGGGVFSPDLCNEWLKDYNAIPLTPDAQVGYPNLYRQDLCGSGGFEAVSRFAPPPGTDFGYLDGGLTSIQGFSADSNQLFFTALAGLTENAASGELKYQIYDYARPSGELHLVSVMPDGAAAGGGQTGTHGATVGGGAAGDFIGTLKQAVSADGSRVYWTSEIHYANGGAGGGGRLYLRRNPVQPESARLNGAASGKGDLIGPAGSSAKTTINSKILSQVADADAFAVGQSISGPNIPAETTITAVEPENERLKISNNATATQAGVTIVGAASPVVSNVNTETGAFQVGQEISGGGIIGGKGIAAGTTVSAVDPVAHTLTLSAPATQTVAGVALAATSECTEADMACTVAVSSGNQTTFWGATPSGSEALYSEGIIENSAGKFEADLYRYDAQSEAHTLLAEHIKGVLGVSEDLSRIYFVSSDVLTGAQKNGAGDQARAGEPNLYLDEEGTETFIGTLLGGKHGDVYQDVGDANTYSIASFRRNFNAARVSADGARIAFQSRAPLTGYDNTDLNNGKPDVEVFTYAAGGELHCVSCQPSGARPNGRELVRNGGVGSTTDVWAAAWIPAAEQPLHESSVLSQYGGRLFFNSHEDLVRSDTNGAQDVYEWEPPGTGRCSKESAAFRKANGGCIYLISSGESPAGSEFWEATPDGHDVFFTTQSSLLPQDPGSTDLYDAREGGGFAQTSPPAECIGEACQSPSAAPDDQTPASASFKGTGNLKHGGAKPRCAKGKRLVRRGAKARCVAKHKRHHRRGANHNRRAAR